MAWSSSGCNILPGLDRAVLCLDDDDELLILPRPTPTARTAVREELKIQFY